MRLSFVIVFIILSLGNAQAEMYRWVDDKGKVHFSDRKPEQHQAEEISDQVRQQNIDYSGGATKGQLQQYERNQKARETERQQLEQRSEKWSGKREEQCREARRRLRILKGRVVFFDKDNNEVKVTEKERERRALALEQEIKKYCS